MASVFIPNNLYWLRDPSFPPETKFELKFIIFGLGRDLFAYTTIVFFRGELAFQLGVLNSFWTGI